MSKITTDNHCPYCRGNIKALHSYAEDVVCTFTLECVCDDNDRNEYAWRNVQVRCTEVYEEGWLLDDGTIEWFSTQRDHLCNNSVEDDILCLDCACVGTPGGLESKVEEGEPKSVKGTEKWGFLCSDCKREVEVDGFASDDGGGTAGHEVSETMTP